MLWTVLALLCGAVAGRLGQRSLVGLLPGALLASTGYWAVRGLPAFWTAGLNAATILCLAGLGYVSARLVGRRRKFWEDLPIDLRQRFPRLTKAIQGIDLPLDLRLAFALFSGFAVHGLIAGLVVWWRQS